MIIDWSTTAVYNTVMAVAAGIGLLLIVSFFNHIQKEKLSHLEGWAIGFAIPGFILTATGLHMTLTWPLSKMGFAFDDIIFGELSLAFGVMMLGTAILLWRKANQYTNLDQKRLSGAMKKDVVHLFKPLSYFGAAMGLALLWVGVAGVTYQLFAAPPEEPISGAFADYPMVEAIFISGLYWITGIGALLFPLVLKDNPKPFVVKTVRILWTLAGIIFVLFGTMNFFTHVGLIVNTMG